MASTQLSADERRHQIQQQVDLLRTCDGSDCDVICDGHNFRLHKTIICRHSRFFEAGFRGDFEEAHSSSVQLEECVTFDIFGWIVQYMYMTIPGVSAPMGIFGAVINAPFINAPVTNAHFYDLMFELHRQADYLQVHDLTVAIIEELKQRLARSTSTLFSELQRHPEDGRYKEAYQEPMRAAVFAYNKPNEYYDAYEPFRTELFRWIERCYPVLCRLGDDFEDYLREAPELGVTILKTMRNIQSSKFISPGPEACCMFCDTLIEHESAPTPALRQQMFGVVADWKGHARYFCDEPSCYRKITKSCFKGT